METLKVGDTVEGKWEENRCLGTVVGEKDMVWVHWDTDEEGVNSLVHRSILTRIEPAVPQALYAVGQRVKFRKQGKCVYTVSAVRATTNAYGLDGADIFWDESELEAAPVDCPTCGGKVG